MGVYSSALRPLLFQLSPDRSHDLAQLGFRASPLWAAYGRTGRAPDPRLRTSVAGIELANPVGLAPGFDKDGLMLRSLSHLGFGYVVVGSATPQPRTGNPKPRLARDPGNRSIMNSMGLPNRGIPALVERLRKRPAGDTPVIASVVTFSPEETPSAITAVAPHVDGVEIGLVCPNAREEQMQELSAFTELARTLPDVGKPVFVKLPPVNSPEEQEFVLAAVDTSLEHGIAGFSVSGGHTEPVAALEVGKGSVAGRRTFEDALRNVRLVADRAERKLPIRASGGVFSGADAAAMMAAGATTVEVYSSFIYEGPGVARLINRQLSGLLGERSLASVSELRNRR
jgi:dihydroorotate dehydrogenase